jgi:hypothetical protein
MRNFQCHKNGKLDLTESNKTMKLLKQTIENEFSNIEACLVVNKLFVTHNWDNTIKSISMIGLIKTENGKFWVMKRQIDEYNNIDIENTLQHLMVNKIDFNQYFLSYFKPYVNKSEVYFLIFDHTNCFRSFVYGGPKVFVTKEMVSAKNIPFIAPGTVFNALRFHALFQSKKQRLLEMLPKRVTPKNVSDGHQSNLIDYLDYYGSEVVNFDSFSRWYVQHFEECYIKFKASNVSPEINPDTLYRNIDKGYAVFTCSFRRPSHSLF